MYVDLGYLFPWEYQKDSLFHPHIKQSFDSIKDFYGSDSLPVNYAGILFTIHLDDLQLDTYFDSLFNENGVRQQYNSSNF